MRIDRVFSEGEAVNALQQLGYSCTQPAFRPDQYVVSHPAIGGERTFTVEQLCRFAEGAMIQAVHLSSRTAAQQAAR
jgi:hypothetical protein